MEATVSILFLLLGIYLIAGLLFAIVFLLKGIEKADESAHGATPGFKIIIIPGVIALWPLLLNKWKRKPPNP
jgi:hypothetical protein